MRHNSTVSAIIASIVLSACQPQGVATFPSDSEPPPNPPASSPVSMDELVGQWRIVSIDGQSQRGLRQDDGTERGPSIGFSHQSYGGTAGCNAMGGLGILDDGRYYTYPGPQTVMLCDDARMQQEGAWNAALRAGPVIERIGDSRLRLSGEGHVLELADRTPLPTFPDQAPSRLAGTHWSLHEIDGIAFPVHPSRGSTGRLSFAADGWTATDGCRTASAAFSQEEGRIAVKASEVHSPAVECASSDGRAMTALSQMLTGTVKYLVGPNGELLMAANGHRLIGELDRPATAQASPELTGAWTLAEVDGARAPDGWTFSFTGSGYGLATGCKPLQGIYVASEARLYAAPLPTIDIGCPAGQGDVLNQIETVLQSGPSLSRAGRDVVIGDNKGRFRLVRLTASKAQETAATAPAGSGTFQLFSINGKSLALAKGRVTMMLQPGTFSIAAPCGRIGGVVRARNGVREWFTDGDTEPVSGCPQADKSLHRELSYAFNHPMQTVAATDGTILIAGSGQWIVGARLGR